MKMTKSELKQIIHEVLKEELTSNKHISEAVQSGKKYVLATKKNPRMQERVFVFLDQASYNYKLGCLLDLATTDFEDSVADARETANAALDSVLVDRLYILQANNLVCVDSFDYLEEA